MAVHDLKTERTRQLRCVALGGGNGLSTVLSGLKLHVGRSICDLSAIVAVSDDGGSSGRLRSELRIPPPGDIRNCMAALSEDSLLMSKLFKFRFDGEGELGGHSFGNIFIAALTRMTGDFAEAIRLSSEILASSGKIYPATDSDVRISARLRDGSIVQGETNVASVGPQIERVFLDPPDCEPLSEAVEAIAKADIITVGPGSLYTSLLPPVLVEGVADAISASNAVKIYVCNLMTQPGETDGLTTRRHIEVLRDHAQKITFDFILINDQPVTVSQAERYEHEGADQIGVDGSISGSVIDGARVVYDSLLADCEKVRHDPEKLANAILSLAERRFEPNSICGKIELNGRTSERTKGSRCTDSRRGIGDADAVRSCESAA